MAYALSVVAHTSRGHSTPRPTTRDPSRLQQVAPMEDLRTCHDSLRLGPVTATRAPEQCADAPHFASDWPCGLTVFCPKLVFV
jgi:hypothetical protein